LSLESLHLQVREYVNNIVFDFINKIEADEKGEK